MNEKKTIHVNLQGKDAENWEYIKRWLGQGEAWGGDAYTLRRLIAHARLYIKSEQLTIEEFLRG